MVAFWVLGREWMVTGVSLSDADVSEVSRVANTLDPQLLKALWLQLLGSKVRWLGRCCQESL